MISTNERKSVRVNGAWVWSYSMKDGRTFGYKDPMRIVHHGSVRVGTADFDAYENHQSMYLVFRDEFGNTFCPRESDVL